jgi:hypothetical protein
MHIDVAPRRRRTLRALAALVALPALALAPTGASTAQAPRTPAPGALAAFEVEAGRSALQPGDLRVNTLTAPIGLGDGTPSLSWRVEARGPLTSSAADQTAYQVRVASSRARLDDPDLWDSGQVSSGETSNIVYAGAALESRQRVIWAVRVWDARGRVSEWSRPATWEMGLLSQDDWAAEWIENPDYTYATDGVPNPLPIFAKDFELTRRVVEARLHVTGLGMYAARLNGSPVGEAVLEPGQTTYFREVNYRTYDVTALLRRGDNLLGIETGSGAYQKVETPGRYVFQPEHPPGPYGEPKAIAQLELTYADGTRQTIATDDSWRTTLGGTTYSSWWGGEDYDARRVSTDWTARRALDGSGWRNASVAELSQETTPEDTTPFVADPRPPVTVAQEVSPVSINEVERPGVTTTLGASAGEGATTLTISATAGIHPGDTLTIGEESHRVDAVGVDGAPATSITLASPLGAAHDVGATITSEAGPTYVLDFGKNYTGMPRLDVSGPAGTTVTVIPEERLTSAGLVSPPIRQILYRYTLSGDGRETWNPQFTYHSFRYVEITGLPQEPTVDTVTHLVTHASSRETASFDSSSDMLNSIYDITKRALEGNMQSVLTDTPNREKGPYTGDNLHNIDTELTLFDMQAYQGQQVQNMRTAQRPNKYNDEYPGLIANIAPEFHFVPDAIYNGRWFLDEPNWGGAVIRIPWRMYQVYGDTEVMRENYDAMVKLLDYEARAKADNNGNILGLGDWRPGQPTDPQAIIDYGYYDNVATMVKVAEVLGYTADVEKYEQLAAALKDEYNAKYLHTDGSGRAWYANNTQASNAAALDAGLVPEQYHDAVVQSLVESVEAFGTRIGTGSTGLTPLFRALQAAGRDDLIYEMVVNPEAPSYAFLVNSGYTTLREDLMGTGSYNHHFFGQVASWFVHNLVGIDQAPDSVAYEKLRIRPALVGDLRRAEATYTTPDGDTDVEWIRGPRDSVILRTTIPANTTAEVWVPTFGHDVSAPSGATYSRHDTHGGTEYAVYDVGPGSYRFSARG